MPTEILMLAMVRAVVEVGGLMLLLRGALWLFGPKARKGNLLYDILTIGSMPFMKVTRALAPRIVRDAHIPTIAFLLVFALWIALGLWQQSLCVARAVKCF